MTADPAAGPPAGNGAAAWPGPAVSDYAPLRPIGSGSYGEVWLVRGATGVLRALKVVRRDRFESEKPFLQEFQAVSDYERLAKGQEGLIDVLHVGRDPQGQCFYYVMELADDIRRGQAIDPADYAPRTLRDEWKTRGRLPAADVVRTVLPLCAGLTHLHRNGLVHRDVKLSNVVFVNGVPKLADIGLVATHGGRSYVGTDGYVPPEGPGAPAADVFALGKILYELATGKDRLAFPELSAEAGGNGWQPLDRAINDVILRACQADPARRYGSADDLLADLRELAASRLPRVRPRFGTGRRVALGSAAVVLLALAAWAARRAGARRAGGSPSEAGAAALPPDLRVAADGGLRAAAAGMLDTIQILDGHLAGQRVSPGSAPVRVPRGADLAGSVRILVRNEHALDAVVPVGWAPSWGPRRHGARVIAPSQAVREAVYDVAIDLRAPAIPGTCWLVFAVAGQQTVDNIFSATAWARGEDAWDDGNDLADLSPAQAAWSRAHGWIPLLELGPDGRSQPQAYGAAALEVRVE